MKEEIIILKTKSIKKPKDLSKWLGLFCITKDKKTKGRISSIEKGIVNIRVFGKTPKGIAHYPIKEISVLFNPNNLLK